MDKQDLFYKYPSIENSYREEFLDKIIRWGYADSPYCITEKIHGSNTQIDYNVKTGEFEYGKRTSKIEEGEACYNVQKCFEDIKDKVVALVEQGQLPDNVETIKVYGEVFGGNYPHEEVKKDNHASKVQKGVYYSPHNEWKAFDIAYTLEGDDKVYFLSGENFFISCQTVGIDTVPLLTVTNNLKEALEYPNDKESIVYQHYALPQLEDNIMEGVVIRPYKTDIWFGQSRLILKNKNDRFKEKSRERKPDIYVEVPESVKKAIEEIVTYVNENRVNNMISHLGEVSEKDIGKVIGLTCKDVWEDFKKESGTFNLLENKEEKMVTKYLNGEVAKVVRKIMLK